MVFSPRQAAVALVLCGISFSGMAALNCLDHPSSLFHADNDWCVGAGLRADACGAKRDAHRDELLAGLRWKRGQLPPSCLFQSVTCDFLPVPEVFDYALVRCASALKTMAIACAPGSIFPARLSLLRYEARPALALVAWLVASAPA